MLFSERIPLILIAICLDINIYGFVVKFQQDEFFDLKKFVFIVCCVLLHTEERSKRVTWLVRVQAIEVDS